MYLIYCVNMFEDNATGAFPLRIAGGVLLYSEAFSSEITYGDGHRRAPGAPGQLEQFAITLVHIRQP
ncbi:protein of unknown function [Magnetospirillum sp. XM-1]|nr:protein of unknown function [Magnetospirillum sp. XM-1]